MRRIFVLVVMSLLLPISLSAQTDGYLSHDLYLDEVRGDVSEVRIGDDPYPTWRRGYDEKGHWDYYSKRVHDKWGRIVRGEWLWDDGYTDCQYAPIGTLYMVCINHASWGYGSEYIRFYDYTGNLLFEIITVGDHGESSLSLNRYTKMTYDKKGNWTRRIVRSSQMLWEEGVLWEEFYGKEYIEERRIVYR